jgi:hypothetical protein
MAVGLLLLLLLLPLPLPLTKIKKNAGMAAQLWPVTATAWVADGRQRQLQTPMRRHTVWHLAWDTRLQNPGWVDRGKRTNAEAHWQLGGARGCAAGVAGVRRLWMQP